MDYRFEGYIKFQYHTSPYRLDYPQMRLEFNCSTNFTWIESDMALWFNFILTIGLSNLWISARSVNQKSHYLHFQLRFKIYKYIMLMVYLRTAIWFRLVLSPICWVGIGLRVSLNRSYRTTLLTSRKRQHCFHTHAGVKSLQCVYQHFLLVWHCFQSILCKSVRVTLRENL